ncbi:YHS domain protein [Defluviimonas sp. WL0002]|uniref:YHS domain protein n=1 Tax=Albidovulum marisflavi TaxID=2984159 RepID=A0ABT2ZD58_9RHOB|nr:YHS domain-containing (seleno)protein [Defluviimonas sp. WL0002]MCV2868998.1 YHS domain protein [Defluviimonas sp. WL0002]
MRFSRRALLAAAVTIPVAGTILRPALAQEPVIFAPDGIALGGYDVVAYFSEGRPVLGSEEFEIMWHGAMWRFASAEALMEFEMNPAAFAPQYGGYCAYAVSKGGIASSMPWAFMVLDGKLYLNRSLEALSLWREDLEANIAHADSHWPAVIGR